MKEKKIRLDELNLAAIAKTLVRNCWIVILVCASVVMSYSAYCRLSYEPLYTSSATFMVGARDSTNAYNSLTATQSMATVFAQLFKSNILRNKVQEQMGDVPFEGVVNTTTVPQTNLLIVSVTSPQPDVSFRSLNLIVEHYDSVSDYVFANAELEVIKDPVIPTAPSNPLMVEKNYLPIAAVTAAVCLVVMVGICIAQDTIQTPKAAKRKLDARVLRTVHHEQQNKTLRAKYRKKNIAPLITAPLISKRFIEDNLSLCSAVEYHMRKRNEKVVLVTSAGENEGKSTIAANLALALAAKGKKVLLLDCDFRKPSLHKIMEQGVDKRKDFTQFLLGREEDPSGFLTEMKRSGVLLGISHAEQKRVDALLNNGRLPLFLEQMRKEMDYVILDTPPIMVAADAEAIARMADTAVMVVRTNFMHTALINDCLDRLRKSVPELIGVVLNNHQKGIL